MIAIMLGLTESSTEGVGVCDGFDIMLRLTESDTEGFNVCVGVDNIAITLGLTKSISSEDGSVILELITEGMTGSTSVKVFKSRSILTIIDLGLFKQSISTIDAFPLIGYMYDVPIPSEIPTRE